MSRRSSTSDRTASGDEADLLPATSNVVTAIPLSQMRPRPTGTSVRSVSDGRRTHRTRTSSRFSHAATSELSRTFYSALSGSVTTSRSTSAPVRHLGSSRGQTYSHMSETDASETGSTDSTTSAPAAATVGSPSSQDPQSTIFSYILASRTGRVQLTDLEQFLLWESNYSKFHGSLDEYLQSYHSVFLVSPVDDTVTLQRQAVMAYDRRKFLAQRLKVTGTPAKVLATMPLTATSRPHFTDENISETDRGPLSVAVPGDYGRVCYASIGEGFHLPRLARSFTEAGYEVSWVYDVLKVSHRPTTSSGFLPAAETRRGCMFQLFCFETGEVVCWGKHHQAHQVILEEFLSASGALGQTDAVKGRHSQGALDDLYPLWATYEQESGHDNDFEYVDGEMGSEDSDYDAVKGEDLDAAVVRFSRRLYFDHYVLPGCEAFQHQVMLVVSHCLARSARLEYLEYVTQTTHTSTTAFPSDFKSLFEYFSTRRRIDMLSGELLVAQLAIQIIKDTPTFLWEMPWLEPFYHLTDAQHASEKRLSWFTARSDALLEQLADVKGRQFGLFMLGSDVFLIVLLILDVIFMTSRLVVKLYFRLPEAEGTV